ncbi:class I SAM-dependent methyltransferase [Bifidobacterium callimiconis]|uniref:FkbM family methyltransferase n=1 Tax=Bifidobacterium callimiconis TaxID=2306973 RepID=A0A430FHX9_9BIFI|nr:class I SAM-dependent methyltransferase [Bifidobacterium callimiconis]RSX52308.1 FkbM family methyltransferase [Bifidobacterium callimiconis]
MGNTKFHGKAQAYDAGRPDYPAVAIRYIDELIRQEPSAIDDSETTIADIGAGTGKLTVPLARLGLPVYAVEPDADMRAELIDHTRRLDNVTVVSGTAAHTALPVHGVDVVTVAQAMHWFNPDDFAVECRRIARDGRYLLISLYNVTSFDSAMRRERRDEYGDVITGSIQHFSDTKSLFFRNPTVRAFPNPMHYTKESWRAYMDSHSHSPLPDDPDYDAYRVWVDEMFDQRAVNSVLIDDTICMVASELIRFGV